MNRVIIVGAGPGHSDLSSYLDENCSVWCVPRIYSSLTSTVDKVFEFHSPEKWAQDVDYPSLKERLIIPSPIQKVPLATIFPLEALVSKYGAVFSSSVSWMVGYAIAPDTKEIILLGVDMGGSYTPQRDSLFYLLGFAKAQEIKLTIPDSLNFFEKKYPD